VPKQLTAILEKAIHTVSAHLEEPTLGDRELLRRFAEHHDQSAFAVLVQRYGGMVLVVCRRRLANVQDAEDACQAAFLVLARKAASGRWRPSLANWLYTTARQIASNARLAARRRTRRERQVVRPDSVDPVEQMTGRELLAVLDEELDHLHARYREPLVLCYLEGLTRDEAAARLSIPPATVKSRLERGRQRLHDALTRRGCTLGAGLLALCVGSRASAVASAGLVKAILSTVTGSPPQTVAELARGVIVNNFMHRLLRVTLAAAAMIACLGIGAWAVWPAAGGQGLTKEQPAKTEAPNAKAKLPAEEKGRAISGRVVDGDGNSVPKAAMVLAGWELDRGEIAETVKELAITDASGGFRCVVPPLGERLRLRDNRMLVARATGFAADWIAVREVDASRPVVLRLGMTRVPVRGRVLTLEGKPIANTRVRVLSLVQLNAKDGFKELYRTWNEGAGPGGWRQKEPIGATVAGLPNEVKVDAQGRFEISGVGDGYLLRLVISGEAIETVQAGVVVDPAFNPNSVRLNPEGVNPNSASGAPYVNTPLYGATIDHVAKPSRLIQGRVFDQQTKRPLSDIAIIAHTKGLSQSDRTVTDAAGRFQLKGLPNTECEVIFNILSPKPTPYLTLTKTVGPTPGMAPATVDLPLVRGTVVTGRVTDRTTGKPVIGAVDYAVLLGNKHVFDLPGRDIHHDHAWSHVLDADGRFRFVAPPGLGIITYYQTAPVVRASRPYPLVRIRPPDRDKPYFISDDRGEGYLTVGGKRERFDIHSFYRVAEPALGQESMTVDIQLDPGRTVAGKVVGPDGQPLAGVTVAGLTGRLDQRAPTLAGAAFTLQAVLLDDRRSVVAVHAEKKLSGSVVVRGNEKEPVVLRMDRWGAVTGRVVDKDGDPIPGAEVHLFYNDRPGTGQLYSRLNRGKAANTDAAGRFRMDVPFTGIEFRLWMQHRKVQGIHQLPGGITVKAGETKALEDIVVKVVKEEE
jgi:RNA polymerase sigma factor (sigma-70 family)